MEELSYKSSTDTVQVMKTDIIKEVFEFENKLAVKSKTQPKILYAYIRNKQSVITEQLRSHLTLVKIC